MPSRTSSRAASPPQDPSSAASAEAAAGFDRAASDLAGADALLIVAAANIGPVQTFLHPQQGGDIRIAGFLLPIWAAQALWTLRFLEVALCARDEGARRWGATRVVDDAGVLFGWWGAALLIDLYVDTELAKEVAVFLMLIGAHWPEARLFFRYVVVRKCLQGKLAPREPGGGGGGGTGEGGDGGEGGGDRSIAEESPNATRTDYNHILPRFYFCSIYNCPNSCNHTACHQCSGLI